jgi:TRAP-type C4-dicarboxylate transport system permease small subunit
VKARYAQAMEWLYIACIGLAGVVMLVMTIIIPYGVFMRYVMNSPSSWPEPAGILLMVVFSFIGGAAAYRARAHIAVTMLLNVLGDAEPQAHGARGGDRDGDRRALHDQVGRPAR